MHSKGVKNVLNIVKNFPAKLQAELFDVTQHYQLQDGGVQLSSFGKDFVRL